MERVVLHSDANSFYASVECLYHPEIRNKHVAVSGDPQARHGIILTKNQLAKKYGVQTGEAIWQAKQKCPQLVCVKPDYPLYIRFSQKMQKIYESYSDRIEAFGLDESWIDLTNRGTTIRDGERIAHEIRMRVQEELGITVSVGVSYNKIFAKLGSDLKKPNAVSVISSNSFRDVVWPLPVGDLLYVGPRTQKKLAEVNIHTIGELANLDTRYLQSKFGKNGLMLKCFANGLDRSPVTKTDWRRPIASVGNSMTPPHDLNDMEDVRCLVYLLAESVAQRLRADGFRARCITVHARDVDLVTNSRQMTIKRPTNLTSEIAKTALALFDSRFAKGFPYRSMGISCSHLVTEAYPVQLDFLGNEEKRLAMERLEMTADDLKRRYGNQILRRAVILTDKSFAGLCPIDDNTVHPVAFYAG